MILESTRPPEPAATFAARVGWRVRFEVIFDTPPYLVMQAKPVFPGANSKPADPEIVWAVFALVEAAQQPGAYWLITCSCGYAFDAEIEQPVRVSHSDPETIIWEIDIPGLRPILAEQFAGVVEGFIRLVFARAEYEADVRNRPRELQACVRAPIAVAALADDVVHVTHLRREQPVLDRMPVEVFEPDGDGTEIEALRAFDIDAPWPHAVV